MNQRPLESGDWRANNYAIVPPLCRDDELDEPY